MRKLSLQVQTSVDGYVGRAGEGPDWQVWNWGPECPWNEPLKARFNSLTMEMPRERLIDLSSSVRRSFGMRLLKMVSALPSGDRIPRRRCINSSHWR